MFSDRTASGNRSVAGGTHSRNLYELPSKVAHPYIIKIEGTQLFINCMVKYPFLSDIEKILEKFEP